MRTYIILLFICLLSLTMAAQDRPVAAVEADVPTLAADTQALHQMARLGKVYLLDGKEISTKEMVRVFENHCEPAYENYRYGRNLRNGGFCFLALGTAMFVPGIAVFCSKGGAPWGIVGGIGAASLVASVPMITLGHLIMRDAYIVFNEENGIGLSVAL